MADKTRRAADESVREYAPYNPAEVEDRWYGFWESHGFFKPSEDGSRAPFVIIMPPPNVTGALHMGHALTASIEDALIRWHRMLGDAALWLPGRDHAGIAGQWVVEKQLAQQGITRHDLGRERFLDHVWDWMHTYGSIIRDQHKRLGASADWDRECFTMDPGPSRAVRTAFVRLYEKGLIYRGKRITNWCPRCQTALSDLEVEHQDEPGILAHVRYPVVGEDGQHVTIATTRPETILADTAVAVNPSDGRYASLAGKTVRVPLANREVAVIADEAVDPAFGTGALKITPGHDLVDFEVGHRHGLDTVLVIAMDGTMNENAGAYAGMPADEARERALTDLQSQGLLVKVEPYTHSVGHCQRCGTVVEPLVSDQWYVRIKPLAEPAMRVVRDSQIEIVPERFSKIYFNWMENIRDWCISRQLWWGHRIPVWYCKDCGQAMAAAEDPSACAHCASKRLEQDPDVLDTWFSSGLWPFSTLDWPDDTSELRRFYPTAVMETGYDILFFWVARMIMLGIELAGDIPFRRVYLHGLIRVLSEEGRRVKMSKTAGNVQDPLDLIERFGTDALRLSLVTGAAPGNDMVFSLDKVESLRDFVNKLWNVGRFVQANTRPETRQVGPGHPTPRPSGLAERWILSRVNAVTSEVTRSLEEFQLGEAVQALYGFIWGELADWYVEMAKIDLRGARDEARRREVETTLAAAFEQTLRLLHPFAPFITEELWQRLYAPQQPRQDDRPAALIVAPWPVADTNLIDVEAEGVAGDIVELVRRFRRIRADYGVDPTRKVPATVVAGGKAAAFQSVAAVVSGLARVEPLAVEAELDHRPPRALSVVAGDVHGFLPVEGLFNVEQELARLGGEAEEAEASIHRLETLLARDGFVQKAPMEVVAREREKLEEHRKRRALLRDHIATLEQLA
jgi:valyl-tRNA synthetase